MSGRERLVLVLGTASRRRALMVRGRTITLSALSLLAIYTLFSREPQSAAGSQQAPSIPAGADDDDPAPDDGDPLPDGEAGPRAQ